MMPLGPRPAVGRQRRLLDHALGGGEEDVTGLVELVDRQHDLGQLLAFGCMLQQVGDGPAARWSAACSGMS